MYLLFVSFWTISPSKLVGGNAANQCHLLINRGNFDKGQLVTVITNNWREQKINKFSYYFTKSWKVEMKPCQQIFQFSFPLHNSFEQLNKGEDWPKAMLSLMYGTNTEYLFVCNSLFSNPCPGPELIPSCKETQLIRFQSKVVGLVPPARRHSMRFINLGECCNPTPGAARAV